MHVTVLSKISALIWLKFRTTLTPVTRRLPGSQTMDTFLCVYRHYDYGRRHQKYVDWAPGFFVVSNDKAGLYTTAHVRYV